MELLLALPGVITSCLLAYVLKLATDKHAEERAQHRIEVDHLTTQNSEQIARLNDAHSRQVANLCQRLQAPQIAVAEHVGQSTVHDPSQTDIENDELLAKIAQRELDLRLMEQQLTERAEELAAER